MTVIIYFIKCTDITYWKTNTVIKVSSVCNKEHSNGLDCGEVHELITSHFQLISIHQKHKLLDMTFLITMLNDYQKKNKPCSKLTLFTYLFNRIHTILILSVPLLNISNNTHNRWRQQIHNGSRKHRTNQFLRLKSCLAQNDLITGSKVIAHDCSY